VSPSMKVIDSKVSPGSDSRHGVDLNKRICSSVHHDANAARGWDAMEHKSHARGRNLTTTWESLQGLHRRTLPDKV
jgi:hypothetical protein